MQQPTISPAWTLRDEIAMRVLISERERRANAATVTVSVPLDLESAGAYRVADEMLAARDRGSQHKDSRPTITVSAGHGASGGRTPLTDDVVAEQFDLIPRNEREDSSIPKATFVIDEESARHGINFLGHYLAKLPRSAADAVLAGLTMGPYLVELRIKPTSVEGQLALSFCNLHSVFEMVYVDHLTDWATQAYGAGPVTEKGRAVFDTEAGEASDAGTCSHNK